MDSPSTTAESKHSYQSAAPWSRISTTSTPRSNSTSLPESPQIPFPIPADLLALLTPQTSSYQAQVQAQLLQYNKLISPGRGGGGGLQSQPPLPTVTSPHGQAPPPRSRSSSKVSNKDSQQPKQPGAQSGHGNRARKNSDKPDRAVITGKDTPPNMPPKQADLSHTLPSRPAQRAAQASNPPAHSSSVPSTPHQHARNFSFESREPSPNAGQNHSPRSAYSDTNGSVPSLRPLPPRFGGCIYETAFVPGRRRMPYSIGSDRLENVDPDKIKKQLAEDVVRRLDTDMRELYDRLQPTPAVEDNRQKMVQKLERIFNEEWSGHNIRVHLFGSSGNLLCSDDSDVDICITTEWKELEGVCIIADLLKKRGMEKVVCVSSAKVPIVKIWDPELGLACDMNVNNTLALENTRMVRTYVETDPRIRPLAMIIKYWTRRRLVNDAAFGGTLSSYTWICMIIIFLQLRDPPVVPALHQRQHQKLPTKDGHKTDFADDLSKLRGYGDKNKSSLGELLFQFFRFYAHEFDYDNWVLSVRLGKLISKKEKKWHLAMNNMLCVEEPFNTARNLGNTADDTSFRGLHIEMRRAFDLIAEGKLDDCCEQYVFPKEEENVTQRVWQKPAPRPAILRSSSQQHSGRGGRGANYRGNRHFSRNGNSNRRASSSQTFENSPVFVQTGLPPTLTPQDIQWYQAQQAQYPFQGDVFGTLNALQMQEHSLRFQLYTQQQFTAQQQALAHAQRMQGGPSQSSDRSRTNSFDQPPLTAPIRPEMYVYGLPLQPSPYYPQAGFTTYPSSPSTTSAAPEYRRSLHRTTVTNDSGNSTGSGSLRSQSQPASRTSLPTAQAIPGYPGASQPMAAIPTFPARLVNGVPIPSFIPDESADLEADDGTQKAPSDTPPDEESSKYIGYYVNDASSPVRKLSGVASGIPAFGDLAQSNQARRRLSTDQLPQSILDRRMRRTSRSPSPLGHARAFSVGTNSAPLVSAPFQQTNSRLSQDNRPLIVNGSAFTPSSTSTSSRNPSTSESRTPDETGYDNPLHINQGQAVSSFVQEPQPITQNSAPAERPLVVNGSNQSPALQYGPDIQSFGQRMAAMNIMNGVPFAAITSEVPNGRTRLPDPHSRQRVMSRQQQNVIAPLDLAIGDHSSVVQDLQHLSPVYETRTPSPTVLRRFENSAAVDKPVLPPAPSGHKEARPDPPKLSQKSPNEGSSASTKKESASGNVSHHRVNGITRENGHVRAAKSESDHPGGWQKPKSKKKQADLKHAANGNPQGEQQPKNVADRKGG